MAKLGDCEVYFLAITQFRLFHVASAFIIGGNFRFLVVGTQLISG
jgi:hypothetical protein